MRRIVELSDALGAGQHVRHARWEPHTKGFLKNNTFFCQRGEAEPYAYEFGWRELTEKKWSVVA